MKTTRQIRMPNYWSRFRPNTEGTDLVRPDGLIDAPEFLVRIIGRQNAELLELLSSRKTARSRRA